MAFTIGLPLGGFLGAKYGVRFPLKVAIGICALNIFTTGLIMPESLPLLKRKESFKLKQANPLGAIK